MEKPHDKIEISLTQRIEKIILDSPREVENEFQTTMNSWLACFKTRISTIKIYLDDEAKDDLGAEKYEQAKKKLKFLIDEVKRLDEIYPNRHATPSIEIQQKLFSQLDILK